MNIINTGELPKIVNNTRLLLLNKIPDQTPLIDKMRPIQIAEVYKIVLEILVEPEIKALCRQNDLTSES